MHSHHTFSLLRSLPTHWPSLARAHVLALPTPALPAPTLPVFLALSSGAQAKSLIKSLSRFSDNDVDEMCQIVQRHRAETAD